MTLEQLAQVIGNEGIELIEITFPAGLKGLCKQNKIWISNKLPTTEKKCVLAEELGHYYKTAGNITDLNSAYNCKQEHIARNWSFEKLIPLKLLINASHEGCRNLYELAEYLEVTEEFLKETLQHYESKYGLYTEVEDYCIYFNPLTVCKYNYME